MLCIAGSILVFNGPSRAVLMIDPVAIEVQLKVKTAEEYEDDEALALDCFQFRDTEYLSFERWDPCMYAPPALHPRFCFGGAGYVRVVDGSWPIK
jgi:hypothetical protein